MVNGPVGIRNPRAVAKFTVHGADLDALGIQATKWLLELVGPHRDIPKFELYDIEPVTISMGGNVVAWSAGVEAEVTW